MQPFASEIRRYMRVVKTGSKTLLSTNADNVSDHHHEAKIPYAYERRRGFALPQKFLSGAHIDSYIQQKKMRQI